MKQISIKLTSLGLKNTKLSKLPIFVFLMSLVAGQMGYAMSFEAIQSIKKTADAYVEQARDLSLALAKLKNIKEWDCSTVEVDGKYKSLFEKEQIAFLNYAINSTTKKAKVYLYACRSAGTLANTTITSLDILVKRSLVEGQAHEALYVNLLNASDDQMAKEALAKHIQSEKTMIDQVKAKIADLEKQNPKLKTELFALLALISALTLIFGMGFLGLFVYFLAFKLEFSALFFGLSTVLIAGTLGAFEVNDKYAPPAERMKAEVRALKNEVDARYNNLIKMNDLKSELEVKSNPLP